MTILLSILIVLSGFALMEFMAWFSHKYVMHGILWKLHRDHHEKDHSRFFEVNDFFFLIFALPGMLLIYFGYQAGMDFRFWLGTGISLYGLSYLFVHDIFVHQRVRVFRKTDNAYLRALRRAHRVHHKHLGKEDGQCFGFLWVPLSYLKFEKERQHS